MPKPSSSIVNHTSSRRPTTAAFSFLGLYQIFLQIIPFCISVCCLLECSSSELLDLCEHSTNSKFLSELMNLTDSRFNLQPGRMRKIKMESFSGFHRFRLSLFAPHHHIFPSTLPSSLCPMSCPNSHHSNFVKRNIIHRQTHKSMQIVMR